MILQVIENRFSRRALSSNPISEESLESILKAGSLAPSCFNNQPWRLVVVTDPDQLTKLKESLSEGNAWAKKAPAIIALCTKPSLDCRLDEGRDYALFDLGMATMNMQLQAEHEGLKSHVIAGFSVKSAKKILNLPDDMQLVALFILGEAGTDELLNDAQKKAETAPRSRKTLTDICFYNSWTK